MIAVPIRYFRTQRAVFVQKLQHAVPSIVVLGDGLDHLQHEPRIADLALGGFEVIASVLVIGTVIRGFQQLRTAKAHADEHHHHGPDWIDVALGVMLAVEAYSKYHATGHVPRPTILLSVAMFAIGFLHGQLAAFGDRRRELRVTADSISVPGARPFLRRVTFAWAEVASIATDDRAAVITAVDGRTKRLVFGDMVRPTAVREALMSARTFLDAARHASRASIESAATDA